MNFKKIIFTTVLIAMFFVSIEAAAKSCFLPNTSNDTLNDLLLDGCTNIYFTTNHTETLATPVEIDSNITIYGNNLGTIVTSVPAVGSTDFLIYSIGDSIKFMDLNIDCAGHHGIKILGNVNTLDNVHFSGCKTAVQVTNYTVNNLITENTFVGIINNAILLSGSANANIAEPYFTSAQPINSTKWKLIGKVNDTGITKVEFYLADQVKILIPQGTKYLLNANKITNNGDGTTTFSAEMSYATHNPNNYYTMLVFKNKNTSKFSKTFSPGTQATGGDTDSDGVSDLTDNCPQDSNPNQLDTDGDGDGDECDDDQDNDGIDNDFDNCPLVANAAQADEDNDGFGDVCDTDTDNDGINDDGDNSGLAGDNSCTSGQLIDCDDNCPFDKNTDQKDSNHDGLGDACGSDLGDADKDGVPNYKDNCELAPNPDQMDLDGDGYGDKCDDDIDDDGAINELDNCPYVKNPKQEDYDSDDKGNSCDSDLDGDGVFNTQDNCPNDYNPDQENADDDAFGDKCDDKLNYNPYAPITPVINEEEDDGSFEYINNYLGFDTGIGGGGGCSLTVEVTHDYNRLFAALSIVFASIILLYIFRALLMRTKSRGKTIIFLIAIFFITSNLFALNTQLFRPTTDQFSTFRNFGTENTPQWHLNVGVFESVANDPLEVRNFSIARQVADIVDYLFTTDFVMDMGFHDRFAVGVDFPIHYGGYGDKDDNTNTSKFTIGDMRIHGKLNAIKLEEFGLGFSVVPFVEIPTGNYQYWVGEENLNLGTFLVSDAEIGERLYITINAGYKEHLKREYPIENADINLKHEFLYGAGVAIAIIPEQLIAVGDFTGSIALHKYPLPEAEMPMELLGGFRGNYKGFQWNIGAGGGLTGGYGSPEYRIIGGVSYLFKLSNS